MSVVSRRQLREWINIGDSLRTIKTSVTLLLAKSLQLRNDQFRVEVLDLEEKVIELQTIVDTSNPLVLKEVKRSLLNISVECIRLNNFMHQLDHF